MTIKQFIEKAIKGGWEKNHVTTKPDDFGNYYHSNGGIVDKYYILLDPLAWQAVGKVEKWKGTPELKIYNSHGIVEGWNPDMSEYQMIKMIHALALGKSLEEFIKTL